VDFDSFPAGVSDRVRFAAKPARDGETGVRRVPESSCASSLDVPADWFVGGTTLQEMLSDSTAIFSGTIVTQQPGFLHGLSVLLLRVKIEATLLAARDFDSPFVDVLYPYAHFAVGTQQFCGIATGGGFDPQVGDSLLVFAAESISSREVPAVSPSPERVIAQSTAGQLFVPHALRNDRRLFAVESIAQAEEVLRRNLAARRQPERRDP
jgi:hypothetical protein